MPVALRQCGGMKLCVHELPRTSAGQDEVPAAPPRCGHAAPGDDLARAVWLGGLAAPVPLCSGLGRCGRCRVRFHDLSVAPDPLPEEEEILGPDLLARGWRLACRRQITDAMGPELHLDVPAPEKMTVMTTTTPSLPEQEHLALAVDLGTTSLYWRLIAVPDVREEPAPDDFSLLCRPPLPVSVVAEGHDLNPQAGAGADVMSRLAVASAPEGRARLARLVRDHLAALLRQQTASLPGIPVERLVLAANTAMTDIFLDRDISGLCAAPYRRSHAGGCGLTVEGLPPLLIPPLPAPFVGGDISAGLLRLLADGLPRPLLLADLGTNGELALVDARGRLWLASVPLGPALEGIGPQCGRMAGPGSITRFEVSPLGLACHSVDGPLAAGADVQGISATGYLSLLALLLRLGCLDADGHFRTPASPLARRVAPPPQQARTGLRLPLPYGQWLAAADVEELLKVKAAFSQALEALLRAAGLAAADVACLALAGALGEHCPPPVWKSWAFCPPAWDGVCVPWATARWMAPPCWPPSPGACPHWHAGAPRPRSSLLLKIPASMPITCAICALEYKCPIPDRKNTVKLRPPAVRAPQPARRNAVLSMKNPVTTASVAAVPKHRAASTPPLPVSRPSAPHGVRKSSPAGAAPASGRPARPVTPVRPRGRWSPSSCPPCLTWSGGNWMPWARPCVRCARCAAPITATCLRTSRPFPVC